MTVSIDVVLFIEQYPIQLEKIHLRPLTHTSLLYTVGRGPKNQFSALSIGELMLHIEFLFGRGEFTWAHLKKIFGLHSVSSVILGQFNVSHLCGVFYFLWRLLLRVSWTQCRDFPLSCPATIHFSSKNKILFLTYNDFLLC